ncbi:MAG: hypothetical protein NZ555_10170 [Geminicoccaceae bacterium]|nr:hypothetical protein [Geminicoccaceae bacterium]MCX8100848.1 hypothetical protein [Geminicoccaceae bacterium]MDW8370519.1 hypothetical protein [Geminicoccaceae bacterium]
MIRSLLWTLVLLLAAAPARAAVLIEARLEGVPLRIEAALPGEPALAGVLVTVAGRTRLVDPEAGTVALLGADGTPDAPKPVRAADAPVGALMLAPLGGGAMAAGHVGMYHLLTEDGRICGEVLAAAWMGRYLSGLVRAVALVQMVEPALAPRARHGCSPLAFPRWAEVGWPLLAGGRDDAVFRTERIRFDHPLPAALAPPPR